MAITPTIDQRYYILSWWYLPTMRWSSVHSFLCFYQLPISNEKSVQSKWNVTPAGRGSIKLFIIPTMISACILPGPRHSSLLRGWDQWSVDMDSPHFDILLRCTLSSCPSANQTREILICNLSTLQLPRPHTNWFSNDCDTSSSFLVWPFTSVCFFSSFMN